MAESEEGKENSTVFPRQPAACDALTHTLEHSMVQGLRAQAPELGSNPASTLLSSEPLASYVNLSVPQFPHP